jgi:hypothetical protein
MQDQTRTRNSQPLNANFQQAGKVEIPMRLPDLFDLKNFASDDSVHTMPYYPELINCYFPFFKNNFAASSSGLFELAEFAMEVSCW